MVILPLYHFLCCLWVLWGLSVCDSFGSPVSLHDGVARWDESILFSLGPLGSSSGCFIRYFCWFFPGFHTSFCIRVHRLPLPFRLDSFLSLFLLWEVVPSIFSLFSLHSDFLDYCSCLCCLRCSTVGFLVIFFLCGGFFLPGLSPSPWSFHRLVSSGFSVPILFQTFSFMLFFVSLVHPLHLACFGHEPFFRFLCLVRLSLSFSLLGGCCPFL